MAFKKLKLWFDVELAVNLAQKIAMVFPKFEQEPFVLDIKKGIESLELKGRVSHFAERLRHYLPDEYPEAVAVLMEILGPENTEETGMFTNFYWIMPIANFVELYGLEHFDESMLAIAQITRRNTSEYAIRPFIEKYPSRSLKQMHTWSISENFHERRLSSEGGRPRLPWARKLDMFIADPSPLLPILRQLQNDTSKYVQNSVANCINDILKDNEPIARGILQEFYDDNPTKECTWIIKHAVRNLRKKEDPWALKMSN